MKLSINRPAMRSQSLSRALVWCFVLTGTLAVVRGEVLSESALQQIQALQAEKACFTPVQQKMDSQLVFALKQSRNQPIANGGVPQLKISAKADANGYIQVDITANVTAALLSQIQSSTGTIINSFPQFNAIRASIPLSQAENIAASP